MIRYGNGFMEKCKKYINVKIVYYGPARSGKTTNLFYIHSHLPPDVREELVMQDAQEGTIVFFDFFPRELSTVHGKHLKFRLYTWAEASWTEHTDRVAQTEVNTARQALLTGADGVVFVVDSQFDRYEANFTALNEFATYLTQAGYQFPFPQFPWVLQ